MDKSSNRDPDSVMWRTVDMELDNAFTARNAGNEGKARVCARRAAGKAFVAAGMCSSPTLAGIREALSTHDLSPEIIQICGNLVKTVNESYNLDSGIDLLKDVSRLITLLRDGR